MAATKPAAPKQFPNETGSDTPAPNEGQTEAPKQKREKDTTPPGVIIDAARAFRKAYRGMGGARPEKIEEARAEAAALRKKVATLVDKPEEMNEAIKEMRKAEGRVDRMTNTDGNKRVAAVDALKELRALVDAQLEALDDGGIDEGEDE